MITNDDGIQSVGLRAAVMAAKEFGDVIVVAPVTQQSDLTKLIDCELVISIELCDLCSPLPCGKNRVVK